MYIRDLVQKLFLRLGWDVKRAGYPTSEEVLLKRFLAVARPTVVFDVGANVGQYGLSLRKSGFLGRIVSFEAIPTIHKRLVDVASRDPDWIAAPCCAVGRYSGESRINVAGNSVSSSLLPMTDSHLRAAPDSKYVRTEAIRVERLDDLAETLRLGKDGRLFLKVDTQGYEEEVLAGAQLVLETVCAMQLELSITPLYRGGPDWRRILDVCADLGFELHSIIPGLHDPKTGRLLQMDGLFLRRDA